MNPRALLASLVATACIQGCCFEDGDWVDQQFTFDDIRGVAYADEVDRCRADASDCADLCAVHWTTFSINNPEGETEVRGCTRDGDVLSYEAYSTCSE